MRIATSLDFSRYNMKVPSGDELPPDCTENVRSLPFKSRRHWTIVIVTPRVVFSIGESTQTCKLHLNLYSNILNLSITRWTVCSGPEIWTTEWPVKETWPRKRYSPITSRWGTVECYFVCHAPCRCTSIFRVIKGIRRVVRSSPAATVNSCPLLDKISISALINWLYTG